MGDPSDPVPESSEFDRVNEDFSAHGDLPNQINSNDAFVITISDTSKYSENILDFTEKSIQDDFVRKVYGVFAVNCVLTCGILAICLTVSSVGEFFQNNLYAFIILLIGALFLCCCFDYCKIVRRKFPINYILLTLIVVSYGFLYGGHPGIWKISTYTAGLVIILGIFLTFLSRWEKLNITKYRIPLALCFYLILILLIISVIVKVHVMTLICVILMGIFYTVNFLLISQLITQGDKKESFSQEDYVYYGLLLYTYLGNMFLFYRLTLLGR